MQRTNHLNMIQPLVITVQAFYQLKIPSLLVMALEQKKAINTIHNNNTKQSKLLEGPIVANKRKPQSLLNDTASKLSAFQKSYQLPMPCLVIVLEGTIKS